jgi:hypothetical protein
MTEMATRQADTNRARERPYRSTAVIVGVLFIVATAFLFVGEAFYGPILESSEVLEVAYPDRVTAVVGVLLEFLCVLAILLIPVFLFPLLRRQNEALALGYVGFRFLEVVLFIAIEVNLLSLISVSEDYLATGSDSSSYEAIAASIRSQNDWIFFMYVITFAIGALVLYTLLYQSRLVPRWLSVWGLIGGGMMLVGTVLIMLEALEGVPGLESELIWAGPIAVQEMVMALWLIIKGFNATALRTMVPDTEGARGTS